MRQGGQKLCGLPAKLMRRAGQKRCEYAPAVKLDFDMGPYHMVGGTVELEGSIPVEDISECLVAGFLAS